MAKVCAVSNRLNRWQAGLSATKAPAVKAAVQQMGDSRYVMRYYLDSQFVTSLDKDTKEPWIRLFQRPWQSEKVTVSVGPADGSPWPSAAKIEFKRINVGWWGSEA